MWCSLLIAPCWRVTRPFFPRTYVPSTSLRAGSGLLCVAPLGLEFAGSIFSLTLQAASSLGLRSCFSLTPKPLEFSTNLISRWFQFVLAVIRFRHLLRFAVLLRKYAPSGCWVFHSGIQRTTPSTPVGRDGLSDVDPHLLTPHIAHNTAWVRAQLAETDAPTPCSNLQPERFGAR